MTMKYFYRRITPAEFSDLMNRAGMSVKDVMYVTGRSYKQISDFLEGRTISYIPILSDVVIMEICAKSPKARDIVQAAAEKHLLTKGEL